MLGLVACLGCAGHSSATAPPLARTTAAQPASTSPDPVREACLAEPVSYSGEAVTTRSASNTEPRQAGCGAADDSATCRFEVARRYFEARRFERAAPLFLSIAHEPNAPQRGLAAELAFESLNVLASRAEPPRSACYDLMSSETFSLLDDLCEPDVPPGAERACATLYIIDIDAAKCSECPPGTLSGREPKASYRAAAQYYLRLARRQCVFGEGKQKGNEASQCAELLYGAYRWFSSGQDAPRAEEAKQLLLDPKNGLDQTEYAWRARSGR